MKRTYALKTIVFNDFKLHIVKSG